MEVSSFYYCLMGLNGSLFLGVVGKFRSVDFLDWNLGDMVSLMVYLLDRISYSIISSSSSSSLMSTLSFCIWSLCSLRIPLLISFSISSCLVENRLSYYILIASCFYDIFLYTYFSSSSYCFNSYILSSFTSTFYSFKIRVSKSRASTLLPLSLIYLFESSLNNFIELTTLSSSELFLRLDSGITPEMLSAFSRLVWGKFY